ncbi:polysaccharide pyruvyl transferase family protein [Alkalimonas sp. MEB108]|uniref:Polysaccharide pyruvyl transferase family protein n=1 Tax=Alkalimonas cellulosilytica TaxID=3058395 RepID=A0ABU7J679_9GAMM|nr:polysaccharide pyruvyl transferase family protein [Alkalimonas sp. MEB108]MEE2001522.1 polysaccharide pyruvyl transferase family protein [Alkalimonas sp. MEB108]
MSFYIERHKRELAALKSNYQVRDDIITNDGKIPLTYWINTENFGDLLSPWLYEKMTGLPVEYSPGDCPSYIGIGSILKRTTDHSIAWGTGSFGTEPRKQVAAKATYLAVRGPLTRARIKNAGVECPAVYGDPALLTPMYYWPEVEKKYELGIVLRWSEKKWVNRDFGPGVKKIYLKTTNIEGVLDDMLSCKRIITSSLHGLIISDAYGIPSAWLNSHTPKGGEFKFYDYFLTVNKVRHAQSYDLFDGPVELIDLLTAFDFDCKFIDFDYEALLDACPLLQKSA